MGLARYRKQSFLKDGIWLICIQKQEELTDLKGWLKPLNF